MIENRWMKLTTDKKKKLLGESWPNMPENHRPDLDGPAIWRLKGRNTLVNPWPFPNEPVAEHLILPDFNKEDLGDNNISLLKILESRSNGQPGDFGRIDAHYDFFNRNLREHYGVRLSFPAQWDENLQGTAVAFAGAVAEDKYDEYGGICQLEGEEHFRNLSSSNYVNLTEGQRVMNIQERIYFFLLYLCEDLVENSNKTVTAKGEDMQTVWKRTPIFDPQGKEEEKEMRLYLDDWSNLVNFSAPFETDWDYISVLSGSRLRNAQQLLRDLKEDPQAFYEYLQEARDHSDENVMTFGNSRHPWKNEERNSEAVS